MGGRGSSGLRGYSRDESVEEYSTIGLSGEESDAFIEKYHNKSLIGSKDSNPMDGRQARSINQPLRNGEMPTDEKALRLMERLEKGIQKNSLPQDMTLFRGVGMADTFNNNFGLSIKESRNPQELLREVKKLVGTTIQDKGFMMTSASSDRNYFTFSDIAVQIQAPKGMNAYISGHKNESEIILPRGTKLKVVEPSCKK